MPVPVLRGAGRDGPPCQRSIAPEERSPREPVGFAARHSRSFSFLDLLSPADLITAHPTEFLAPAVEGDLIEASCRIAPAIAMPRPCRTSGYRSLPTISSSL